MKVLKSLYPAAQRVCERLIAAYPQFGAAIEPSGNSHFEASIPAPEGSQAGALVVCMAENGDVWVHFALPQMWYPIENEEEMLKILDLLLRDEVLFVRTVDANGNWLGTTLVCDTEDVEVQADEVATVLSWSGRRDDLVKGRK